MHGELGREPLGSGSMLGTVIGGDHDTLHCKGFSGRDGLVPAEPASLWSLRHRRRGVERRWVGAARDKGLFGAV